jgi:AcrR family transcriptional regulator
MSVEIKKRKYDSEDSRRRLIRAGIDVFSKEGFDAATTRTIAKKAGVNEALIHRYFKNKSGLLLAAMTEFHQNVHAEPPYAIAESVEEEIKHFFQFRLEIAHRERKFIKLSIVRAILNKKVKQQIEETLRNGTPALMKRLEQFRTEGKIKPTVDLDHLCTLLGGISFSMVLFSGILKDLEPKYIDSVTTLAAKLIADGLTPKNTRAQSG